jgi:hypothetical protein
LKSLERELLNLCLGFGVDLLDPAELHLAQLGLVPESEGVLQGNTGSNTNVSWAALVGQLLAEGDKVDGL